MRIETFLRQSPLFAVRRASRAFDRDLARILQTREITFQEALVLVSLLFEEPKAIKPSELAETLSTTRGNVSHCVSSLEAKGLVRRRIDPADARAFHVLLKPAGRSQAMRVVRILDRLQKDFERQIRASDLDTALSVIQKLEQICAALADSAHREQGSMKRLADA